MAISPVPPSLGQAGLEGWAQMLSLPGRQGTRGQGGQPLATYPLRVLVMTSFLWPGCRLKEMGRERVSLQRRRLWVLMSPGFTL